MTRTAVAIADLCISALIAALPLQLLAQSMKPGPWELNARMRGGWGEMAKAMTAGRK